MLLEDFDYQLVPLARPVDEPDEKKEPVLNEPLLHSDTKDPEAVLASAHPLTTNTHKDKLGEGPRWDAQASLFYWVDIDGKAVNVWNPHHSYSRRLQVDSQPGFVVENSDGHIIVGMRKGMWEYEHVIGRGLFPVRQVWDVTYDPDIIRINDGKTDRAGRIWFGTMDDAQVNSVGKLYRYDHALPEVAEMKDNVVIANGLGWSPDNRKFYFTGSNAHTIWQYDYDFDSGEITNESVFTTDPSQYVPDGLCVDADGCVWGAKWNGGKVVRYTPDGKVDREIVLPVKRTTSAAFVGDDLRTLAVTTAQGGPDDPPEELAGRVFLIDVKCQGLPDAPAVIRS